MDILQRIMKREAPQSTAASTTNDKPTGCSYAENVVQVNSMKAALNVPAFARAIQVIADTMSQCVMQYQKYDKKGGNFVPAMHGKEKHINYLVQVRPNPMMAWNQLVKQAEMNRYFKGNAFIYIERDNSGEIKNFWLCTGGTLNQANNTYSLTYNSEYGVVNIDDVPAARVIHLRNPFSINGGLTGVNILYYAYSTLTLAATNDKQALDTAAKGGRMKILVQENKQNGRPLGNASKKELEKITQKLGEDVWSQDAVLLNNVADAKVISQTSQAMELIENRKLSNRDVARITGVPPVILMDDSNSSYKSPEAAQQEFLMHTIAPKVTEYEEEFNFKAIGEESFGIFRYHFCTDTLMRLDPKGQAEINKLLLETAVKSPNELRCQYDLPTIPHGDIHYVSTNLAELGSKKLRGSDNNGKEVNNANNNS